MHAYAAKRLRNFVARYSRYAPSILGRMAQHAAVKNVENDSSRVRSFVREIIAANSILFVERSTISNSPKVAVPDKSKSRPCESESARATRELLGPNVADYRSCCLIPDNIRADIRLAYTRTPEPIDELFAARSPPPPLLLRRK